MGFKIILTYYFVKNVKVRWRVFVMTLWTKEVMGEGILLFNIRTLQTLIRPDCLILC